MIWSRVLESVYLKISQKPQMISQVSEPLIGDLDLNLNFPSLPIVTLGKFLTSEPHFSHLDIAIIISTLKNSED